MSVALLAAYEELTVLAEFLDARSAEDEEVARAATVGPWEFNEVPDGWDGTSQALETVAKLPPHSDGSISPVATVLSGWGYDAWGINVSDADAAHIATWNPARVLAECKVKRDIAAHLRVAIESYARSLRELKRSGFDDREAQESNLVAITTLEVVQCIAEHAALPYAGHPDYREEWEPAWSVDGDMP